MTFFILECQFISNKHTGAFRGSSSRATSLVAFTSPEYEVVYTFSDFGVDISFKVEILAPSVGLNNCSNTHSYQPGSKYNGVDISWSQDLSWFLFQLTHKKLISMQLTTWKVDIVRIAHMGVDLVKVDLVCRHPYIVCLHKRKHFHDHYIYISILWSQLKWLCTIV